MSPIPRHIFIDAERAQLRSFSSLSSRGGETTIVKIELAVSDPYALANLMQSLAEFKKPVAAEQKQKRQRGLRLPGKDQD